MARVISFIISIVFYLVGVAGLFYLILWIGNFIPINQMESETTTAPYISILINFGLILLFGIQHSVMARTSFKASWTKLVPKHLERSIYVFISGILCICIALFWSPIPGTIFKLAPGTPGYYFTYGLYFLGIAVLLASTFLINHFELFGLQQAYLNMVKRTARKPRFTTFALYKIVRHPIYMGFALILWATPIMSISHLYLAVLFTGYIFAGIYFEEKDLIREFGNTYKGYKQTVPPLIPFTKIGAKKLTPDDQIIGGEVTTI